MFNLSETLNSTVNALDSSKAVEIEKLADLVESQISNVLGGGYSQYSCCHLKDVQQ
ncbi:MAG TPA: hypothetical protein VGU66_10675 [Candidatus Elarobacter sp.]|nr:hypothetical protein [Candidatus Elarobacter sp.]